MSGQRVNIGCGATPTQGWLNLDNSWTIRGVRNPLLGAVMRAAGMFRGKHSYVQAIRDHDIRHANAAGRLPLADGAAEVLYTSHMVEHMTRAEVARFLDEAKRALRPGGILRIAVPDVDYHVGIYRETGDADGLIAGLMMASEPPQGLLQKLRYLIVGERHHLWMYNGPSLAKTLADAGFADVAVMPAGETRIPNPGALDLAERAPESVFVEATRP
jgi:SAM-dependent methyltransferase